MSINKIWVLRLALAGAAVLPLSVWSFNTAFLRQAPLAYFTDSDWTMFKQAFYKALNDNPDGTGEQWSNPSSGDAGEIRPLSTREVGGTTCRQTRIVSRAQGLTGTGEYLICKAPDGDWTLGSE